MILGLMLVDGQEIIADVEEDENYYNLTNPYRIESFEDLGTKLTNVCTLSKNNVIRVKDAHVITMYEPIDTMITYYNKMIQVTSKITMDKELQRSLKEMDEMEEKYKERMQYFLTRGKTIN